MTKLSCADPEKIVRGPTLTFFLFFFSFLVDEGREDPYTSISGPFKWRSAGVPVMAQHGMLAWQLCDTVQYCCETLYFVIFRGGGGGLDALSTTLDPHMNIVLTCSRDRCMGGRDWREISAWSSRKPPSWICKARSWKSGNRIKFRIHVSCWSDKGGWWWIRYHSVS